MSVSHNSRGQRKCCRVTMKNVEREAVRAAKHPPIWGGALAEESTESGPGIMRNTKPEDYRRRACVQVSGGARKRVQMPGKRVAGPGLGASASQAVAGGRLVATTISGSITSCILLDIGQMLGPVRRFGPIHSARPAACLRARRPRP